MVYNLAVGGDDMKRRVLSIILIFIMLLGTTSCGGEKVDRMSEEAKKTVFRMDSGISFEGFASGVSEVKQVGDYIISYAEEYLDDSDSMMTTMVNFYVTPVSGGNTEKIYSFKLEGYIRSIFDCNGNIGIAYTNYGGENEESTVSLDVVDMKGNVISQKDITEYSTDEDSFTVSSIVMGNDGNYYFCFNNFINVFDTGFNKVQHIPIDGYLAGVVRDKDGKIIVLHDNEGITASHLDTASGSFTDSYKLSLSTSSTSDNFEGGDEAYDFYLKTDNAVYGCSFSKKEEVRLCDYTNSDMMIGSVRQLIILDDKTIFSYSDPEDGSGGKGEIYKKVDPSEVKDKKILTLMCQYAGQDLKRDVIEFNKSHTDYKISIIDYSEYEDAETKISADIAAGKIPDIYFTYSGIGRMSFNQCIAKGMLEDLTPYIDKDPELSQEDFVPNVLEAMKINGGIYYLSPSFDVKTVAANGKYVPDTGKYWTLEEMKEFVDDIPEETMLFDVRTKMGMLQRFIYSSMDDFVDWEEGDCSFDSEGFKDILIMSNRGLDEEPEYEAGESSYVERMRKGEQLFADISLEPNEYLFNDNLFEGNMVIVGYPNESRNGIYAQMRTGYAISSSCENKDAAWDFVRQYMTREYQGENYLNGIFSYPLRQDIFDCLMQKLTTTEQYTDEFGHEIFPLNDTMGWGDGEAQLKPFSEEQIGKLKGIIGDIHKVLIIDTSLEGIVEEEAQPYFAGDKSLEDTAYVIQNRSSTYIKENK